MVWDGLRTSLSGDVAPSVTVANLIVQVTAPPAAGSYCLVMDLVQEGVTWFSSQGAATLNLPMTVNRCRSLPACHYNLAGPPVRAFG